MRIDERLANFGLVNRHRYVAQAAINCGIEFALKLARNKSVNGYVVPDHTKMLSREKLAAIISGDRHCASYLANACLDAIVAAGYCPSNQEERLLYCVMILTRSNVKDISTAITHIPDNWPIDIKDSVKSDISNIIDGVNDGLVYQKCG